MANRSGPAVLQVYIFKDGQFLGTDIFAERQVIVGRDPDEAHLVLESAQVSRKHALIELDGATIRVKDAGSTNGVFVNENRVTDAEVGRLDEIKIGEYTLKLKVQAKGGPGKMVAEATEAADVHGATSIAQAHHGAASPAGASRGAGRAAPAFGAAIGERTALDEEERPRSRGRPMPSTPADLSEFDDLGDDDPPTDSKRLPQAEFRKRGDVVDKDDLDDMLEGLGIESRSRSGAGASEAPTHTNVRSSADDEDDEPRRGAPKGSASKAASSNKKKRKASAKSKDETKVRDSSSAKANGSAAGRFERGSPRKGKPVFADDEPSHEERGDERRSSAEDANELREGARERHEPRLEAAGTSIDADAYDAGPSEELAPPPTHHDDEDDDHDEEDEADYRPSYSLAKHILSDEAPLKGGVPRVEVLALRGDLVDHVVLLEPGESYWIGPSVPFLQRLRGGVPPRFQMVKYRRRDRQIEVEFRKSAEGHVVRNAQQVALSAVQSRQGRSQLRRGTAMLSLSRGEVMQVNDGPFTYSVREVVAPAPVRDDRPLAERLRPDRKLMQSAGGAVGGHLFFALFISLLTGGPPAEPTVPKEEFIEVSVEPEMKLEEPPPEPVEEPPPPPPEQKPAEKIPPKAEAAPKKIKVQKVGGTSPAPAGVLGLLNKTGSSAAPGPATAVAAISNLAAAKVPGGTSGYKVSGLIGKLPTSDLSIGGGGGGPMTKGAAALLRGGAGGAGQLSGKGQREVGGLVQKVPQQMRAAGQGTLDRDEIQKVINKNISQIQRCYERELLKSAGLQGKVQVEWTVAMSGAVKSTRQKFSDMNNTNVVNCILGAIKGWEFPQPKGGEVVVSYPFIFKPIGF